MNKSVLTGARRWMIFYSETTRMLQFWLGMPVQDRTWKFVTPDINAVARDEL